MTEDFTSVQIRRQELEFFRRIMKKNRLTGMWALFERIKKLIRRHKMEEEI